MRQAVKLLFCIKALNNPGGGAERVMVDIANGLSRLGHNVNVLTFERPGGQPFYPLDPAIERIDLGVGLTTSRATVGASLQRIACLRGAIKEISPDIVVGFMHSMFVLLAISLMGTRTRIIASEHIVPDHYASRRIEGLLLKLSTFLVEAITCVSEQAKAQYPFIVRRKMVVIPNPIVASSAPRAEANPPGEQQRVLLTVGRLVEQKDQKTLIRAFAAVATDCDNWKLRIVGDGELRDELECLIQELGMEKRIEMRGSVVDISSEYSKAQAFILSSRYESFGLATAEALAHGLPAIGFADCAGTNVLIKNGRNGILVDPGNDRVGALAAAIRRLLGDHGERWRLSTGAVAPAEFGLDAVLNAWTELFGQVIARTSSR